MKHIENYEANKVKYPNLAAGGRYSPSGLSFMFRSDEQHNLDTIVKAQDLLFEITNITVVEGGMGNNAAFIYRCECLKSKYKVQSIDLRKLLGKAVTVESDEEAVLSARRARTLC